MADINHRADIDFVIHCGDLTDTGTIVEFEWSHDILSALRYPYVALVGNHDFLGTGDQAYRVLYGQMNFSFIASHVKFVCLNTNATEYDYMAAVPDFDFMEEEFTRDSTRFDRTIVVMHAPPYSDQFNNNVIQSYKIIIFAKWVRQKTYIISRLRTWICVRWAAARATSSTTTT